MVFCALASSVYIINDLADVAGDRLHPKKKFRPIASGALSPPLALTIALLLIIGSLAAAFYLDLAFALVAVTYLVLMICYTFWLRSIVILDVFTIALGFVLRAIAGVVVIGVVLSPWLIICTLLLSLFIALGKRRHELITLASAASHRKILDEYNPQLLDQLISISAGATIVSYALYSLWPDTVAKFQTQNLIYTLPFVVYGIFRYLYLIYKKERGGRPEMILLTDFPLILGLLLWVVTAGALLYWAR